MLLRVLALGAIVLASLSVAPSPVAAGTTTHNPAPDPRVAKIEMDFLMGMIPHHRGAIEMAQMVLEKSTNPELRELALGIIDEQEREIILMTAYLQDWYGMMPPDGTMMPPEMMAEMEMPMLQGLMPDMAARMEELRNLTGQEFEIAFMTDMIHHHSMAIMMATPVLMVGYRPELRDLAAEIVKSQAEEIQQMQRWLLAWYGVENPM